MGVAVREKSKGSGIWWVFIIANDRKLSRRIGDKKLALEVADKIKARMTLGDTAMFDDPAQPPAMPIFKVYSLHWLETYIKPLRRSGTYERCRCLLEKYLNPEFGRRPLDQIKRVDLRSLILKYYGKGLSRSTVCSLRDVVSGVMNYAIDEELISSNPVKGIMRSLNLERDKKGKVIPFSEEEIERILLTCKQYYPEHYPFIFCAFRTGMRMGELSGLQWGDIDWTNSRIRVQRSYKNGEVSATKTDKVRLVDMSKQLLGVLQDLHNARSIDGSGKGAVDGENFVFGRQGIPLHQNSVRNFWHQLLKKAEVKYRKFHDTRHTFASLLLSKGESPVYVKEQLGHSSIQITVDIYGHWIRSAQKERAVDKLDRWGPEGFNITLVK